MGYGFPAVYSVGEIREIGAGDLPDYLIRNALYVIPQPIQYCGTLTTLEASGFYFPNNETDQLRLELRIYQRECDGTYASAVVDTITFVPDNISDPYGLVMKENMDTLVIDGDLVSISVFTQCSNNNRCPIQPVILPNSTTTTMPAVWYNSDSDINNLMTRSDVFLNVRVSIGE